MRFLRRLLLAVVVLVVAAPVSWWATHRDQVRALRQTATIAATLRDVPVLSSLARATSDEPQPARSSTMGELPATVVRPAGTGDADQRPAVVLLVPGGTDAGDSTAVRDAQHAVARAGIAAWAVRVPDRGLELGSVEDTRSIAQALRAIADDAGTRDGQVSVVAAGTVASQALLATVDPAVRSHVAAVVAAQPVADVRSLVELAVTGQTEQVDGTHRTHASAASLRRAAGEAVVDAARDRLGGDASSLVAGALDAAADADDPLSALAELPSRLLPGDVGAIRDVVAARTPDAFDAAWDHLPSDVAEAAAELSPSAVADRIDARVLLVVPDDDRQYPSTDAERLEQLLPHARLLRTPVLDPDGAVASRPSGDQLRAAADAATWWLERAGK